MPRRPTALERLRSILKSRSSDAKKATMITELAPKLPCAAIAVLDEGIETQGPLVQVALMDAYHEMTEDDCHEGDLEKILEEARKRKDGGEELYMAARLAIGRITGASEDSIGEWGDGSLQVIAVRTRGLRKRGRGGPRIAKRKVRDSITILIHGTWAADGTWWRPGGDFFQYVKTELHRGDLYGGSDRFRWSGKNRDISRRKAGSALDKWLRSHAASEVNVFAHSHGANVAMLATRRGIELDRLVMLSPPVRPDYFADWKKVGQAYNIQADHDPVVAIARGGKWFRCAGVKEKKLEASGHSKSHDPAVWRSAKLADFIGIPWS